MSAETPTAGPATIRIARHGRVATITLDRPKALNALNAAVLQELTAALATLDADPAVGCLVITGSDKAFAAGADIREMAERSAIDMMLADHFAGWDAIARIRKPIVAAVAGYALGGGCELAMMCDFIIAADTARFGQPEIKLGVMPGMGGTQRLARAIGTAKAMELCLTGRVMDAAEAERAGLVVRVVPAERLQEEAMATATAIAGMSLPAVLLIKEAIHRTSAMSLAEGIAYERRIFHGLFGTHDQKEGMAAFLAKRPAQFTHR